MKNNRTLRSGLFALHIRRGRSSVRAALSAGALEIGTWSLWPEQLDDLQIFDRTETEAVSILRNRAEDTLRFIDRASGLDVASFPWPEAWGLLSGGRAAAPWHGGARRAAA